jgi:hypothetical protein
MNRSNRPVRSLQLLLLAAVAWTIPVFARQGDDTPEAVAAAYMEAMRAGDWRAMADLMHPDALRELRGLVGPIMRHPETAQLRMAMFQTNDTLALAAISDDAFFAAFTQFVMSQDPISSAALRSAEIEVLGRIMEGDTAHVVSRMSMVVEGASVSKMEVASFRRADGKWRSLLTGDVSGIASMLQGAIGRD